MKYTIPTINEAEELARKDYETSVDYITLTSPSVETLSESDFEEEENFWYDEDDIDEENSKQKRKKRKRKKKQKRALDMLEAFDWQLNGAPKTPAEAKGRRKELKRQVKGKSKKLKWRGILDETGF